MLLKLHLIVSPNPAPDIESPTGSTAQSNARRQMQIEKCPSPKRDIKDSNSDTKVRLGCWLCVKLIMSYNYTVFGLVIAQT